MSRSFNIVAQVQLRAPNNTRQVATQIQRQLQGIRANVNVNIAANTSARLSRLNTNLQTINTTISSIATNATNANAQLQSLAAAIRNVRTRPITINVRGQANQIQQAADGMEAFGQQAALAARRYAAFVGVTSIFLGLVSAIKEGVASAIEFEKEAIRLSQVTGRSVAALSSLTGEITRLSTGLGVSSKELGNVATTLAQAGLSAKDTKVALEALARSSLAATFTSIEDTTEGAIAVFRQFGVRAGDLQGVIGSLNAVSAQFAVESDDLVSVIRRTGGAFKAAGGNLNELLGLFTAVRSTTRESADSIATGFRTIFTRIQRPRTIQYLKELGVELSDAENRFIGPLEAIRRLNAALSQVPTNDPRFAAIVEELGGFRQVSKVIPLIQQFPEALKAITVAQEGQLSIVEDSEVAQKSLSNQIAKVREEFLALFREITDDKSFKFFAENALDLAKALIEITRNLKPMLPLLASLGTIQLARGASSFGAGFLGGLTGRRRFASGGIVPGSGNGDTVPAMLTPGEFVLRKDAVKAIGTDKLFAMNRFARGGKVKKSDLADIPGPVDGAVKDVGVVSLLGRKGTSRSTGVTYDVIFNGAGQKFNQPTQIVEGSLSEPFASQTQSHIIKRVTDTVAHVSKAMLKQLNAQGQINSPRKILEKAGLTSIVGNIFEASLASAGAPYDEKVSENFPIDFPKGVGSMSGLFENFPGNIPTDATRAFGSRGKKANKLLASTGRFYEWMFENNAAFRERFTTGTKQSAALKSVKGIPASGALGKLAALQQEGVRRSLAGYILNPSKYQSSLKQIGIKNAGDLKKLSENLTPDEIKQLQSYTLKRAKGGDTPGFGTDTVPAMLTPGEFVVNKNAAKRIGYGNLEKMNKVQKFARGGRVGGGNVSSEGGFAFLAGLSALTTTFDGLSSEAKETANTISSLGVAATSLNFILRETSGTLPERLRNPRFRPTSGLGRTQKFLAENFDILAGSVAAVTAALVVFGQKAQTEAQEMAKNAKTQSELNRALSSDKSGSRLLGAGTGAGIGAVLGSALGPLGILGGAAAGAGIGALFSGIFENTKELVKSFEQAKFDRLSERIDTAFDNFTSGRSLINGRTLSDITAPLQEQIKNINANTDIGQRAELNKQLRSQITNVRNVSTALSSQSNSIEQFETAFGGAGKNLIDILAYLGKTSYAKVREQIQKEITARVAADAKLKETTNAFSAILTTTTVLNQALNRVTDSLNEVGPAFETLAAGAQGDFAPNKFIGRNGINNGAVFARAQDGVFNQSQLNGALDQILTGTVDAASQASIKTNASSVALLARELPNILNRTSARVGLGGDGAQAQAAFEDELDGVSGITETLKNLVRARFGTELASRESSGEAGFLQAFRADPQALFAKLLTDADKVILKDLEDISKVIADQTNILADRLATRSKIELDIMKRRIDIEEKKLNFERDSLREGEFLSIDRVRATTNAQRNEILNPVGLGAGSSVAEISAKLETTLKSIFETQEKLQSAGDNRLTLLKELDGLNVQAGRLRAGLENLANSTLNLNKIQERIGQLEKARGANRTLTEDLLFGDGKDRVKFSRGFTALDAVVKGKTTFGALGKTDREFSRELLGKLPEDVKLGFLGGKTRKEFEDAQLRKELEARAKFEGVDPKIANEIANAIIIGSKEEGDARLELARLQTEALTAQKALNAIATNQATELKKLNDTTLANLGRDIVNAINEAKRASIESRQNAAKNRLAGFNQDAEILTAIGTSIGVSDPSKILSEAERIQQFRPDIDAIKTGREQAARFRNANIGSNNAASALTANFMNQSSFFNSGSFLHEGLVSNAVGKLISQDSVSQLGPGFQDALQKNLESRLKATSFVNAKGLNKPKFGENDDAFESFRGLAFKAEFDFQNQRQMKEAFDTIVRDSINETIRNFGNREANRAGKGVLKLRNAGFSEEQIGLFTSGDFLGKLDSSIGQLSETVTNSTTPFQTLRDRIAETVKEINELETEKNKFPIVPPEKKASGGFIRGPGSGTSDSIAARLSNGEFVVRASAVKRVGVNTLSHINQHGEIPGFADGGKVNYKEMLEQRKLNYQAKLIERRNKFNKRISKVDNESGDESIFFNKKSRTGKGFITISPTSNGSPSKKRSALEAGTAAGKKLFGPKASSLKTLTIFGGKPSEREKRNAAAAAFEDRLAKVRSDFNNRFKNRDNAESLVKSGVKSGLSIFGGIAPAINSAVGASKDRRNAEAFAREQRNKRRFKGPKLSSYAPGVDPFASSILDQDQRNMALYENEKAERRHYLRGIKAFATGGFVPGAGNRDSVPALLTPGEFVLNRRAAKAAGLGNLQNFNNRFANGGLVKGGSGGSGGVLELSPEALSKLSGFNQELSSMVGNLGSTFSMFTEKAAVLANAMSGWMGTAHRLSEALSSMPSEINVVHSPINVNVNVVGLEGMQQTIAQQVLAMVDARMASQAAKAADGKNPFMSGQVR